MQVFPVPRWLQYDAAKPVEFSIMLNVVFAFATMMIVGNLSYCQPLLIRLAASFGVDHTRVADIPTLIHAGYAVGLLFLSPLGDLVPRRSLILALIFCGTCFALGLALAPNIDIFSVVTFLVGFVNVTPQVLLPLAADLSPPSRRAQALSIVIAGALLGVVIARVLSGIIAQYTGPGLESWRNVYWMAFSAQIFTFVILYFTLPDWPQKNRGPGITYWGILKTLARLAVTEPLLIQCSIIGFLSYALIDGFWVTLTFLLGGPPYNYSTLQIGLFGLIGAVGVITAPLIGLAVDRLRAPWHATLLAVVLLLISSSIMVGAGGINIGAVIVVGFGFELGLQLQHIGNVTRIFGIEANARARLNAVFSIVSFMGQVVGTQSGTRVFETAGWRTAAALNFAWAGGMLIVLLLRGPHCANDVWIGGWRRAGAAEKVQEVVSEKGVDA